MTDTALTGTTSAAANAQVAQPIATEKQPRLGFIGTGWIGRLRMEALLRDDAAKFCAVHDPSSEAAEQAAALTPGVTVAESVDDVLNADIDGVVIATPSALHASQCIAALESGKAVFCQKPLARSGTETRQVLDAARAADRLLSVDFSYRFLAGMPQLRDMIQSGELGDIYAADLVFHNAYGPDKSWFYDVKSSGGGCVMDLGIHLVDLLMWLLDSTDVSSVSSRLFHQGRKLIPPLETVEDYAVAEFDLGETHSRLCCSWNLNAGQDAVIEARLYGTQGGASLTNIGGSFFDFEIHHLRGTERRQVGGYPDDWGGRALSDWVARLSHSNAYDPAVEKAAQVAEVIDRIYCR